MANTEQPKQREGDCLMCGHCAATGQKVTAASAEAATPKKNRHSEACLSVGGGPSDDRCICGADDTAPQASQPISIEDDPRLVKLMDSQWEAGRKAGWNAGVAHAEDALKKARRKFNIINERQASGQPVSDDGAFDQVMRERDSYHEIADKLADAIAKHFGADIGEHSSANCPWTAALEVIENADSQPVSGTMTDEQIDALWIETEKKYGFQWTVRFFARALLSASGQAVSEKAVRDAGWISVDDQLPDIEVDVIVRASVPGFGEHFAIAGLFHDEWMSNDTESELRFTPTHWMPIPPLSALSSTPAQQTEAKQGWYCANCGKGVPPEEVTYSEHHTICGGPVGGWPEQTEAPVNVPSGFKLVPIDPAQEMIDAAEDEAAGQGCPVSVELDLHAVIREAIAAAPAPVQTEAKDAERLDFPDWERNPILDWLEEGKKSQKSSEDDKE